MNGPIETGDQMVDSPSSIEQAFQAIDSQGRRVRPGCVLIDPDRIDRRINDLAAQIAETYTGQGQDELVIVAIMTGAMVFLADLVRAIRRPIRMGIMIVTNYPGVATKAVGPQLDYDLRIDITDKHVLVIDDILDTGGTLAKVTERIRSRSPRSVRTCVLLEKDIPDPRAIEADFVGFRVPNEFVIGYGLDYDGLFRNYPGIAVLESAEHEG
ncbi:MAG: hypoxanthine phosphoribosyltransferase [Phycisphaerae bacterium]|nr:hypoxanthine phosphoribosyltransferase [Phycisphaerae bacterium]